MPYIVTTYKNGERIDQTAVATHFDAREQAALTVERIVGGDPDWEETYTDAQNVSELGDTFGPLQDGSIVSVTPISWQAIIEDDESLAQYAIDNWNIAHNE